MAHRRVRRLLAAGAMVGCSLVASVPAEAAKPRSTSAAVIRQINAARAQHGLPALRSNRALADRADAQAAEILATGNFSHASRAGSLATRLRPVLGSDRTYGETIAFMPSTAPGALVRAWLRSPPHRAVLLSREFRHIGIGARPGSLGGQGGVSFTADLAS